MWRLPGRRPGGSWCGEPLGVELLAGGGEVVLGGDYILWCCTLRRGDCLL